MSCYSLLYISRSRLEAADAEAGLADITSVSRSRNAGLGVTGALMYTGTYFTQNLEGKSDSIEMLMEKIRRDPRHEDIQVVYSARVHRRRFHGWSIAHAGSSIYVRRTIQNCLRASDTGRDSAFNLIELMTHFTAEGSEARPGQRADRASLRNGRDQRPG